MTEEHQVIFFPSGKRGLVPENTTILQAARRLGVDLDSVCGGLGICSKCQVEPTFGEFAKHGMTADPNALSPWNAVEERYRQKRGLLEGRRLGCQARIAGDVVVSVPPESQINKQVIRKEISARPFTLEAATKLFFVRVDEPDMKSPTGDFERLRVAMKKQWDLDILPPELSLLSRLQPVLRRGNWEVTVAVHTAHDNERQTLIDVWPGLLEESLYGIAIDLGSTTIAAHLVNLETGEVVASAGQMNPQIRFGEDLMSRVSYAMMNPDGSTEMTRVVRETLGELCSGLVKEGSLVPETIVELVFVCNPIMHHLLLGLDPVELGQAPFALATSDSIGIKASEVGIMDINPRAQAYILPCIAGHVGADAAAVVLSEVPNQSEDLVLIVDVGTNAEIILGNYERVLACSSPTGPAFEGAQISSGQRAAKGAIERVEISPATKEPRFQVIGSDLWSDHRDFRKSLGDTQITGICGSGIIEAVAEMRLAGIMDQSGLIGSPKQTGTRRSIADGRTYSYVIYEAGGDPLRQIAVTQADVRAIQLAKSALYAGARLLMDEMGVATVARVVLAGAFGAHISPKHALILGMIPDVPLPKVTSAGNAAGNGALIALCNRSMRTEIEAVVGEITKVETAIEPRFQEHFVAANGIPHGIDPFPNLSKTISLPTERFRAGGNSAADKRRRRRKN
ncbi:MAG: ASKHA domain-containing protein [Aestuariivita sp.]|nr:ASKHA domain-containing protein [Aestuariivita sp.]MCY4347789.1 ASKHA domain-containing protein [Aestuariivita sp.]